MTVSSALSLQSSLTPTPRLIARQCFGVWIPLSLHLPMLITLQEVWGYMLICFLRLLVCIILLLHFLMHVILLLHFLALLFGGGVISPGQATCPKLCDTVRFLASVGHKIRQHDRHSFFCPAEIVGHPMGWDPLHLVSGGVVCQDAPFEYEAMRCTKVDPFFIGDPKLRRWHNCAKVDGVPTAVAILLSLCGGTWYGCNGRPYKLVPGVDHGSTHCHVI